ncbi:unnamed protein product [Blepharisma stoltei]|uniref:Uncharacterized protein n=1 Tax=Blepharisma stoltei TaxID=1481888 RepID=A0AAU9J8D2_9CILI|nr:unnamed protein product [Blepharisma stoltei]
MNLKKKLCAEAYGTFMLTFVIVGKYYEANLMGPAFWMCVQGTNMIHSFHFNPCVTLASWMHKKMLGKLKPIDSYLYWSFFIQIIGAIPGVFAGWWIYDSDFYFKTGDDYTDAQKFFAELIFSIHIILCPLGITFWPHNRLIGSLVVAGGLTAGIHTVEHISGACFNPTICFTVNIIQGIRTGDSEHFKYLWIYFIAPVIAMFIAAGLACIIHFPPEEPIVKQVSEIESASDNNEKPGENEYERAKVETAHAIEPPSGTNNV